MDASNEQYEKELPPMVPYEVGMVTEKRLPQPEKALDRIELLSQGNAISFAEAHSSVAQLRQCTRGMIEGL